MVSRLSSLMWLTVLTLVVSIVAACAAPAATPTATPKPAVKEAPTPTKVAPTPTKVAIRWEGGKLQPLPDGWPSKPIELQATEPASSTDTYLRGIAKAAQPFSPVPVVVFNRSGSSDENIMYMLSQPPEGYIVNILSGSAILYIHTRKLGYAVKDLKPVITTDTTPIIISVPTDSPFQSLKAMVDFAKANPGKVKISAGGTGNWNHIVPVWLGLEAKVDWVVIPGESSGEAILTAIGGGADAASSSAPATSKQIKAGKVRALGLASSNPSPEFPGVPTFKQAGIDVAFDQFRGLVVSAGVPDIRAEWLHELFKKVSETPEYKKIQKDQDQEPFYLSAKDTAKMLAELDPKAKSLAERLGLAAK